MSCFIDINSDEIPAAARPKVEKLTHMVSVYISALVDNENEVRIVVQANHRRVMFTVHVAESDVAFAIGTGGRHADALRTLLVAACRKLRFHFDMDIIGPSGRADWSST